jgi:mono/diheme cytochrome c family protein
MRFFLDPIEYDHTLLTEWTMNQAVIQTNQHMNDQRKNQTELNRGSPMKFMIPFLIALVPVASVAQARPASLYLKPPPVVFAGRCQGCHLLNQREDPRRGPSGHGNPTALEGTVDGLRIHSGRTLDAADGIGGRRSAAVTLLAIALPQEGNP